MRMELGYITVIRDNNGIYLKPSSPEVLEIFLEFIIKVIESEFSRPIRK